MPLEEMKRRQIDAMMSANAPNVQEIVPQRAYSVSVRAGGGRQQQQQQTLNLKVFLPDGFPQEAPRMQVEPRAEHPILDPDMNVRSPHLSAWHIQSNLGRVVRDIVDEFIRQPPRFYNSSSAAAAAAEGGDQRMAAAISTVDLPSVPDQIPEMASLTLDELEELSVPEGAEKLARFYESLPMVKELHDLETTAWEEADKLARENLAKEPKLTRAKRGLAAKYEQLAALRSEAEALEQRHATLARRYAPDEMLTALRIALRQAEDACEEAASAFRDGDTPVDEFVKDFKVKKHIYHLRRAKEELMTRELRN